MGFIKKPLSPKILFIVAGILILLVGVGGAFLFLREFPKEIIKKPTEITVKTSDNNKIRELGGGDCTGEGPVKLTHLPMREEDFSTIVPYGLMIDAHVTPIDHWYFSPADFNSALDAYPVYAIADGSITAIGRRRFADPISKRKEEFRLVFTHTCTFLTYYDLVTILDKSITEKAKGLETTNNVSVNIPVKAGQEIGRIGGQTLDFAVWDIEKPLTGFINPDSYKGEPWKIYTTNPFDYFTPQLVKILTAKNPRAIEPTQGKIDYDVDGKLIGNWFLKGSNGYIGRTKNKYWSGHLSVVYNHLDPTSINISIGNWDDEAKQFAVIGNKPDPAKISKESGPVKYELAQINYQTPSGEFWDRMSLVKGLVVVTGPKIEGVILLEVLEGEKLKMEVFPGKTTSQITSFSKNAKIYER